MCLARSLPENLRAVSGSRLWKGLLIIWNDVRSYVRIRIGDGNSTDFWRDSWIAGIDPLVDYVPENLRHNLGCVSVADMADGNGSWLWYKFEHLLSLPILLRIAATGCPMEGFAADTEYWKGNVQGNFTVKSAYVLRCGPTVSDDGKLWQLIHKYRGLQRIKIFLWLACLGRVLTNSERVRRHLADNASCTVCGSLFEDVNHVLRWCPQAIGVWSSLIKPSFLTQFLSMNFKEWLRMNLSDAARMVSNPENWDLLFGSICWNLWLGRNAVVFDNPLDDRGTVLERSRRLMERCLLAFGTAALALVVLTRNGTAGHSATELRLQQCMAEG
ncbi:hypothetical protein V6N13_051800 [Hibiscus sabdariffa]